MARELTIDARTGPTNFEITVDGTIDPTVEDPVRETIVASGSTVEGLVDGTPLAFRFSGDVTDITVTNTDASVCIDGEAVDPESYRT
ncbi:hypothetical protein [Natronobiforma cellulositropha]|uniref:hypothetical protein n=1 Tax=Natronobiforma cellulositropha TaxID=1679076 RepID=UPI0021D5B3B9|nr:hypothetical protein [Natronobiforma cellulositropha]